MPIVCLAKVSPLNPSTGNRVDLYISSAQNRAVTGLNGQVWEPAMAASPTLSINLWQGDFREPIDTGGASFSVNMGVLKMTYAGCDAYNWSGAPVEIYAEEPGTAWPWSTRFKGRVASYSRRSDVLTINASIETELFDKNILTATYAGTGGAEGGADLKGRLKPLVVGWAQNVEPILVDAVNSVYQFSGYGAIEAVSVLYERAASFGASVGDYATYAALVAATIPAGRWGTCLAAGMVRLGAPAAGVITGDVRGHRVGGTTPRLSGAVISALATIAGVSTANIETATLTSLDTAVPYPINLVLTEQVQWREMAAQLALACNWQSGITLPGKWFTLAVTLSGSEVITLNAQGAAMPQVIASDEADVSLPYYQTIFGANRCWRTQTSDEIAFTAELVPLGLYAAGTTYREGNIVDLADGSTWVYINATASSGNAPPTWPTTSNAYWSNRTPPIAPASIGAATSADVAAAYALALSRGKVWTGLSMPSVAESNVGDTWIAPDGTFYDRVNEGGILLDGFAITLAGFRPRIAWTLSANQALRDTLIQADAAYTSANDAIDQLIGLADDNLITRNEKITKLIPENTRLEDKWTALSSVAASLSVSTAAASSARTAWISFLAGISPAWNDTTQDTVVARASFNSARDTYDNALYDLDRAIKAQAATVSTWAGVSGSGRPADNATRNVVTYSSTAPSSPIDGDLWVDTSGTFAVFKLRSGGAWVTGANALSAYNALSGKPIALADINTTESSKLSGIQAGATVGAPSGTPVGTITAGDVSGTINAGGGVASNQVPTPAIQPNAVSVTSNAYTTTSVALTSGSWVDVQSITVSASGAPILLLFNGQAAQIASGIYNILRFRILRDATVIYGPVENWSYQDESRSFSLSITDTPSSGTRTYKVQAFLQTGSGGSCDVSYRSLIAIETKR